MAIGKKVTKQQIYIMRVYRKLGYSYTKAAKKAGLSWYAAYTHAWDGKRCDIKDKP